MIYRIIGAFLVFAGCGGFGFYMVQTHRRQTFALEQLIRVLEYMECELSYQQTPLPELIRKSAGVCSGKLQILLIDLVAELESQLFPDATECMALVLRRYKELPPDTYDALIRLGRTLGSFDTTGQCKGILAVKSSCERCLEGYRMNQDTRLRTYRTLGLCAGAALVILFI